MEDEESRKSLIDADVENLEESVTQLEALSLDSEDVRKQLAQYLSTNPLIRFIEHGDYPPYWQLDGDELLRQKTKSFDVCKAAAIKVLVSVAGEDNNLTTLWDKSATPPGSDVALKMADWIKKGTAEAAEVRREDLVICGCLTLGNLVRNGEVSSLTTHLRVLIHKARIQTILPQHLLPNHTI